MVWVGIAGMFVVFPFVFLVLASSLRDEQHWTISERHVWVLPLSSAWVTSLHVSEQAPTSGCCQLMVYIEEPVELHRLLNCTGTAQKETSHEYELGFSSKSFTFVLVMDVPLTADHANFETHFHLRWALLIPMILILYFGLFLLSTLLFQKCRRRRKLKTVRFKTFENEQEETLEQLEEGKEFKETENQ